MKTIIFGSTGLLGSAIKRSMSDCLALDSSDFDASNYDQTRKWFKENSKLINVCNAHICAGKVAGIGGQNNRHMFVKNMLIGLNIINCLAKFQKKGRTIYYSSSCVYPKNLDIFEENDIMTGEFEPSNEGYALAKASVQKLAQYWNKEFEKKQFITIVPPNLWGENDNWNINECHVLPALVQKMYLCKKKEKDLEVWGKPDTKREFMKSDDVANAANFLLSKNSLTFDVYNTGQGSDITIEKILNGLSARLKFSGKIKYNGKHVGKRRKLLKTQRLDFLKWKPKFNYEDMLDFMVYEVKKRLG